MFSYSAKRLRSLTSSPFFYCRPSWGKLEQRIANRLLVANAWSAVNEYAPSSEILCASSPAMTSKSTAELKVRPETLYVSSLVLLVVSLYICIRLNELESVTCCSLFSVLLLQCRHLPFELPIGKYLSFCPFGADGYFRGGAPLAPRDFNGTSKVRLIDLAKGFPKQKRRKGSRQPFTNHVSPIIYRPIVRYYVEDSIALTHRFASSSLPSHP